MLRIIACFMVIVYHTRTLPILKDGTVSETAIFIECMCTVCVVTFFLISGFFIYKKKNDIFLDWWYVALSYLKTLCIVGLLMAIACLVFQDYIENRCGVLLCIRQINIKDLLITLIDGIKSLSVNRWPGVCAHLWYVFSYGLIILYYPITRLFLKLDKKVVYVVLILLAALQLYDDILVYYDRWALNKFFEYVPRPVIYSVWGHMLYNDILRGIRVAYNATPTKATSNSKAVHTKNYVGDALYASRSQEGDALHVSPVGDALHASRSKNIGDIIISKKVLIISIVMYVISFVGIFYMQYMYNTYVRGIHTYTAWYSIGSLTLSMALVMFVVNINIDKYFNDNIKKIIYVLGGMTLGIYMLHFPIVVKLNATGFQRDMQVILGSNLATQMVYVVFYNLLIFVLSILLLFVVRFVGNSCKMIFRKFQIARL